MYYRRCRETRSPDYNASTRNAFKENRRSPESQFIGQRFTGLNSRARWSLYPGLFCSSLRYLSNNISDGCANSHLQIQNAVHHNHCTRADLHSSTKREDVTSTVSELELYFNKYRHDSHHANKQNCYNLFASRANMKRIRGETLEFQLYLPYI